MRVLDRHHVGDSHRNERQPLADRAFHFAHHLPRIVGMLTEDDQHRLAGADRLHDTAAAMRPRLDIVRRDPASDVRAFERTADLGRRFLNGAGVTDEDVVSHPNNLAE